MLMIKKFMGNTWGCVFIFYKESYMKRREMPLLPIKNLCNEKA